MKAWPFLILLLVAAATVAAQQPFRTIYRFEIAYDIAGAQEEWLEHDTAAAMRMKEGEHLSTTYSDSAVQNNPYLLKYHREVMKMSQSKLVISGICTPECYFSSSFDQRTKENTGVVELLSHGKSTGPSYFHRKTNTSYKISIMSGSPDTSCAMIDSGIMTFIATGQEKAIGKWKCKEYKSVDTQYADVSYWLTNELPTYIRPGIYNPVNVAGALVQISYTTPIATMTLLSVNPIDEIPEPWPCGHYRTEMINPLDVYFRKW